MKELGAAVVAAGGLMLLIGCKKRLPDQYRDVSELEAAASVVHAHERQVTLKHDEPPGLAEWFGRYVHAFEQKGWVRTHELHVTTFCTAIWGDYGKEGECFHALLKRGTTTCHVTAAAVHVPTMKNEVYIELDDTPRDYDYLQLVPVQR